MRHSIVKLYAVGSGPTLIAALLLGWNANSMAVGRTEVPPPHFSSYPATEQVTGQQRNLNLSADPRARRFRSILKGTAAAGANFGGRYAIAMWGCGTSCQSGAIIDLKTGHVAFPAPLEVIAGVFPCEVETLQYRKDSRLLRIINPHSSVSGFSADFAVAVTDYVVAGHGDLTQVKRIDLKASQLCAAIRQDHLAHPTQQRIFFDFDSLAVKMEYMPMLEAQAGYLKEHPDAKVYIEGHTDERGSREFSLNVGARRAQSVAEALIRRGVDRRQIETISYGEERPLARCHDESCWVKNRRVDITYTPSGKN